MSGFRFAVLLFGLLNRLIVDILRMTCGSRCVLVSIFVGAQKIEGRKNDIEREDH